MKAQRNRTARILVALGVLLSAGVTERTAAQQRKVTTEAEELRQFQSRIDQYMELHSRLEKESPPLKAADDPEAIRASQKGLAEKIRAERKKPVQGAIFTAETRTIFRRRLRALLQGPNGNELERAIKEDAPSPIPLRVNSEYPAGWPLSSVPPTVLAALPQLPEDLAYRFVGNALILLDVHANLILDFIPNAIR